MSLDSLAAAVVDELNAATWPTQEFTAVYEFTPQFRREDMGTALKCCVVPSASTTSGRLDRRRSKFDQVIDVGFAVVVPDDEPATIRALIQFMESVQVWFDEQNKTLDGCSYQGSEFQPLYDAITLRDSAIFLSVLAVTYRRN